MTEANSIDDISPAQPPSPAAFQLFVDHPDTSSITTMKPSAIASAPWYRADTYNPKRALPRMSWKPENLYNVWQRTSFDSPARQDINFSRSSKTIFQQRWIAKRLLRGYHADFMGTSKFERWFLPPDLPTIHTKSDVDETAKWVEGRYSAGGRAREDRFAQRKKAVGGAPIGSLMYQEIERRLDVAVFRACFAESIYMARHFVLSGRVKLNGQTIRNTNTVLNPGDIFSVDPKIIPFLQKPPESKRLSPELEAAIDGNESTSASESEPSESTELAESTQSSGKKPSKSAAEQPESYFTLPPYASPSIFVPAYLLPSYLTCSCVYVRHPTARNGYSEIASPFDAGGELMSLGWEWYKNKAPRMRSKVHRWWNPQRTKEGLQIPRSD